jgi:hypothetical protein
MRLHRVRFDGEWRIRFMSVDTKHAENPPRGVAPGTHSHSFDEEAFDGQTRCLHLGLENTFVQLADGSEVGGMKNLDSNRRESVSTNCDDSTHFQPLRNRACNAREFGPLPFLKFDTGIDQLLSTSLGRRVTQEKMA